MPNRGLLRRQMRHAWADTIRTAYMDQVISSERALQVHFTARLMDLFWEDGVKRRVFVEPKMQLDVCLSSQLRRDASNVRVMAPSAPPACRW